MQGCNLESIVGFAPRASARRMDDRWLRRLSYSGEVSEA